MVVVERKNPVADRTDVVHKVSVVSYHKEKPFYFIESLERRRGGYGLTESTRRHYEILREADEHLRKKLSSEEKKKLYKTQAKSLTGRILIQALNELWNTPRKKTKRRGKTL